MGLIERIFGRRDAAADLYAAIVARGREEHWYVAGGVADTIDGRFDMIAAILSLTLLRLEDQAGAEAVGVALAERFVDDMDPQLREIGIGDIVVGKHVGRMMSMLGGRLGAYRAGLAAGSIDAALRRNLYRDRPVDDGQVAHVHDRLMALHRALAACDVDALAAGKLP